MITEALTIFTPSSIAVHLPWFTHFATGPTIYRSFSFKVHNSFLAPDITSFKPADAVFRLHGVRRSQTYNACDMRR